MSSRWLASLLVLVAACADDDTRHAFPWQDAAPRDAVVDAAADATADAVVDVDAGADAATDASVDAAVDASVDSAVDASVDAAVDAAVDASVDAAVDASVDASVDAAVDASVDAAVDASVDGGGGGGLACQIPLDATVTATLNITADDSYALYVNGLLVDDTPRVWTSPQTYTLTLDRHPAARNVIAIAVANLYEIDGHDRGVVADLSFTADGAAAPGVVVTDGSWRLSTTPELGWSDRVFDDAAWTPAVDEGPHGMAPWGDVLGTSDARWIWSYDSGGPAVSKPEQETIYVRKAFSIAVDGSVLAAPGACP